MKSFTKTRQLRYVIIAALFALSSIGFAVQAQDATPEAAPPDMGMPPLPGDLVVGDLSAPRGVAFDANGNLLVAVAGRGGDFTTSVPSPDGSVVDMSMGMTGVVLSVAADGTATPLIPGFPSYAAPSETTGLYRAIPNGDSLWVLQSGGGPTNAGHPWMDTISEIDMATMHTIRTINLNQYEAANDPDGRGYDTNVSDIAWLSDGTMLITDAGCNCLLSWTEEAGLATVATWGNDVPTSVEVAADDSVYVGFLGEGLAPGAAKIEHWANGELVETFSGLNAVSDILLDGDTLYAVQLVVFGEQGPGPGSVVMVSADGVTPVAEGLLAPFGIAKGPDGALYVSFGTIAFAPGMTGGVVRIETGM